MLLPAPTSAIPTNIITGFLGTGKTSLIKQLLTLKPKDERWAILVNEFGEVGIDGAFFKGRPEDNIYIREVPGGCMCCTSGLPMQIALNQLISYAKPHRLLIEPTGVGHPKEVLAALQQPHYQDVFDIQATLTLVDARVIAQPRYRENLIYQEQLSIADRIIATKIDLYKGDEVGHLKSYLAEQGLANTPLTMLDSPLADLSILAGTTGSVTVKAQALSDKSEHKHEKEESLVDDLQHALQRTGRVTIENTAQGFSSQGWIFNGDKIFDFTQAMNLLSVVEVDRLKAVLITEKGIFGFDKVDEVLTCIELDESPDSRLEIIDADATRISTAVNKLESTLFA
ncbi:cobalamin synthesis protein, P47K [Paraglaciecola sp. T6c]|uniref:CobW family GTP-binding protein n=1 Tax=Pseudoalteromonas atlantica (strain T6c / ATCC BAA-1087) TaxID=3042615 RepID=UPI0000DA6E30|nr:GTP-binding protein [Paraglaciecola sp. T6c]ABG41416.1 cobalamin synthesis protein, P47K [Paraglaciecola sp. T6c]